MEYEYINLKTGEITVKSDGITEWLPKQKRAFRCIMTGVKLARRHNEKIRFLTLSTSEIQYENIEYDYIEFNESIRKLKQRIQRITIMSLLKDGYIKSSDIRRFYPNIRLKQKFKYEYFRIRTNEGYGVAHILYKGEYIPYNWLVDNWLDLHNSWNIDIRLIKKDFKKQSGYIVSQYLSNQNTSYIRSSQSWGWIIRNHRKEWENFLQSCKVNYFHEKVHNNYYKRNKRYIKGQVELTDYDKPPPFIPQGLKVDIYKKWDDYIYGLTLQKYKQVKLDVYN